MPVISVFFGVIIRMFYKDAEKHHLPHLHAEYQGQIAVFSIADGSLITGSIPKSKEKLVVAWIEIHRDDLLANWALAIEGSKLVKIKGLE